MFSGESCSVRKRPKQQDDCWSYVICFCATLCQALIMGIALGTFGVLLPVIMQQFNSGRGQTAWIGALAVGLSYFAAPAVGRMSDCFGCRVMTICGSLLCALSLFATSFAKSISHVFVSYGLLFGLGAACVRTCTFLVAAKHFNRRRSMATGLVSSGTGLGIFVFGPIAQELLGVLGLQNTYLVLAGFALFAFVLAVSFPSTTEDTEEKYDKCIDKHVHKGQGAYSEKKLLETCFHDQRRKIFRCSPWRAPTFTVLTLSYATICLGDYVPLIHLVKHCRELGIGGDSAARLIMFFGIASFSARLLIGKLGDCKCVSSLHLIQVGSLGLAITILLLPLARAYTAFVVFSIVDGFLDGVIGSQFNLVLLTTVSPQLRATAFGYANCLASLTLTIGPSIAGILADKLDSYIPAFFLAGSEVLLGSCLTFLLCLPELEPKKRTDITEQQNNDETLQQIMCKTTELNEDKGAVHLKVGELDEELLCPLPNAFLEEETLSYKCTSV